MNDEPDNAQPIGLGLYGTCVPAAVVVRRTQEMKSRDQTRPVMINFGQGLANEFWRGRGLCTGDKEYYSIAAQDADILSFDIYPVGSSTPQVKGKLEYVARGVTNLMKHSGQWPKSVGRDRNYRPRPKHLPLRRRRFAPKFGWPSFMAHRASCTLCTNSRRRFARMRFFAIPMLLNKLPKQTLSSDRWRAIKHSGLDWKISGQINHADRYNGEAI